MPKRKVRSDATGPYVKYLDQIFRPDPKDAANFTPGQSHYFYERGGRLAIWLSRGASFWTTSDPPKAPKSKTVTPGTDEYRTILGGAHVIAKMNDAAKLPLQIAVSSRITASWEKWDEFVEEINKRREALPIARIAATLQKDLEAEDELLAYMKEKGLA